MRPHDRSVAPRTPRAATLPPLAVLLSVLLFPSSTEAQAPSRAGVLTAADLEPAIAFTGRIVEALREGSGGGDPAVVSCVALP